MKSYECRLHQSRVPVTNYKDIRTEFLHEIIITKCWSQIDPTYPNSELARARCAQSLYRANTIQSIKNTTCCPREVEEGGGLQGGRGGWAYVISGITYVVRR